MSTSKELLSRRARVVLPEQLGPERPMRILRLFMAMTEY